MPGDHKELRNALMQKMKERGEASMKELVGHVKEKFWKELRNIRMSDEALENEIRGIMKKEDGVRKGSVTIQQKSRTGRLYNRPVLGYKLKGKTRGKARAKPSIKHAERMQHTEELTREVIKPWLEQLPDVDITGTYFPASKNPFKEDSKLPIESHFLFNHFREHICYLPNPFKTLESFKQKAGEYWVMLEILKNQVYFCLGRWISRDTRLKKYCEEYVGTLDTSKKLDCLYLMKTARIAPMSTTAKKILRLWKELNYLKEEMKNVLLKHRHRSAPFSGDCELLG